MRVAFDDAVAFTDAMKWVASVAGLDGAVLMDVSETSDVTFRAEGDPGMRRAVVPGHVEPAGAWNRSLALSGPHISQMVSALGQKKPKGGVTMEIPKDGPAVVSSGHLHFPVPRLVGPSSLQSDRERFSPIGDVDCGDFMGLLRSAQKLTGSQTGAVSMVDLTFDPDSARISAMGTDKYIIGVFTSEFQPTPGYVKDCADRGECSRFLIVPSIGGMSFSDPGTLTVSESPDSMALDFGDGRTATMRKQAAEPLRWMLAIERQRPQSRIDDETPVNVNVHDLLTSASIVSMGSGAADPAGGRIGRGIIILGAAHGLLSVRSGAPGSPTDSITTGYDGEAVSLRFNLDELKRMLSVMPDDDMVMLTHGDDPVFIMSDTMTVLINQSKGA